ncbi:MAG: alpha/beta hydrolase [Alphaproteobacteria bacterium]|nr:alpha/beta hydrolase [Alphaproteobacteria bacterium]
MSSPAITEPVQNVSGDTILTGNLLLADGKSMLDGIALITHGTLAHSSMEIIKSLQENLQTADHSSLAINLSLADAEREFMYDCKVPHRHRHQDAVMEIESWVGWLKEKGATSVTVIGHSRGGNQTAWYATERISEAVDKVVLIAPATWSKTAASQAYESRYKVSLATHMEKADNLVRDGQGGSIMSPVGFLYCAQADVTADSFLAYYRPDKRFNTPDLLADIPRPTLVVAASDDKVIRDLISQIQSGPSMDHIKLEVVDGAGHFFRDLYGEDLSDLIVEFLEN